MKLKILPHASIVHSGKRSNLRFTGICLAALTLTVFFPSTDCTQSATPDAVISVSDPETELIHYGDLIDVDVLGSLEFDWRGTLNPEGFLDGFERAEEPVYALCKSTDQIASEITRQYAKTLRDPKVVVSIVDRSGRAVSLLNGAVKSPQRLRLQRQVKLSEVLALSGGIIDTASGEITIFRPKNLSCLADRPEQPDVNVMRVRIADLLSGNKESDPVILSGDVITVVEAAPIFVIGGVNNPRQIPTRDELTLSHAISTAGGLAKDAVESDVTIYRREPKETRVINVDLKKIRSKQQDDIALKPRDIVDVGQKGRSKPKFPPTVDIDTQKRDIYKIPVRVIE